MHNQTILYPKSFHNKTFFKENKMNKNFIILFTMISGTMISSDSTSQSSLGLFETSKINALNTQNDKRKDSNDKWKSVHENLNLSTKHVEQLIAAHDRIDQYAQVGTMTEKDLNKNKNISGKNRSKISKLRHTTTIAQDRAQGKLHRAENLVSNLLKHLESSVADIKKDLETNSKDLIETQKTLAQADAQKATETPKKEHSVKNKKSEPKKIKKEPKKSKETKNTNEKVKKSKKNKNKENLSE